MNLSPRKLRRGLRYAMVLGLTAAVWLTADSTASAAPFTPAFAVTVSNSNPGVRANTTMVHSVPAGNNLIDSINTFIPIDWQIAAGDSYPVGNIVGQVSAKADKGCNGSVDTLTPGNLINQVLEPMDPSQAEWLATIDGTWQMLFVVDQTTQPREWQIAVTLANASMPANMCAPEDLTVTIFGSSSPAGALVIANPTHANTYPWDDGLLSYGGSQVVFVSDNVVIGTDTDTDGWANTVDNCPTMPNPDQLNTDGDTLGNACDSDDDNDGFSDAVEVSASTDPLARCGPDAWPPDINNDGFSDISDVSALTNLFGQSVPPAPARYNIAPDPPDTFVDITDVARMVGLFGQTCS
jgi:Bacterial TSP3 repeat/Thrombospondin type 3 repeat